MYYDVIDLGDLKISEHEEFNAEMENSIAEVIVDV
jgi:hypothetical protein